MRRVWYTAHLYLGLSIGLIVALAGVTGSLLVFYVEIDRWLNSELIIVQPTNQTRQSYEAVFSTLRSTYPERTHSWRLEVPLAPNRPVIARYYKATEKSHLSFAPLMVAVNPYTLEVINSRFWGEYAMTWIYDLHYTLLLDKSGKVIVAILGISYLFLISIGMYLWWPKSGNWKNALKPVLRHGVMRKVYDLHRMSGVYGLVFLLILIVTGVVLVVPDWVNPPINALSPLYKTPKLSSNPKPELPSISADQAIHLAQQQFPNAQLRWLENPDGENGVYSVRLKQAGEPGDRFPKTQVWIDRYSGNVLAVRNPQQNKGGDIFLDWQHPLHSGEAFGLFGRILVLCAGMICPLLLGTGLLRWLHKRRAKPVALTKIGAG